MHVCMCMYGTDHKVDMNSPGSRGTVAQHTSYEVQHREAFDDGKQRQTDRQTATDLTH